MNADEEIRKLQEDIYNNKIKEDPYSGITPLYRNISHHANEELLYPYIVPEKIITSHDEKHRALQDKLVLKF